MTGCIARRSIAAGSPTSPIRSAAGVPSRPARRDSSRFRNAREEGDHKVRGKAERFADHYTQATLFWNSQTDVEKQHIINAFRFELSRVQTPAVRERMVSGLMNVAAELAEAVAAGLGIREMPAPMPKVMTRESRRRCPVSPALSLFARPGDGSIRARRVAILVADGCDGEPLAALAERLTSEGAVPRFVSTTLGAVQASPAIRSRSTSASKRRRRCSTTRWCCPTARTPSALRPTADARVHQGPVPPLQAHLGAGRQRQLLEACGIERRCPDGSRIPG